MDAILIESSPAGHIGFCPGLTTSVGVMNLDLAHQDASPGLFGRFLPNLGADPFENLFLLGGYEDATRLMPWSDISWTSINSLPGEPYTLLQPIPVKIERIEDNDSLASFEEANIAMSGETEQEAFQNLVAAVLDSFEDFSGEEASLGPEPARQLRVLRRYLVDPR